MDEENFALSKSKQIQEKFKSLNLRFNRIEDLINNKTQAQTIQQDFGHDPTSHRDAVGGMWEEIGRLQFNFLVDQGLKPDMQLVDIGCGSLRGGVHFIKYLHSENYYGIDINSDLIKAGYEQELNPELREKCPQKNLLVNDQFKVSLFQHKFDFALAQSVFTHLPLNSIRRCLLELDKSMKPMGKFYATFFEVSSSQDWIKPCHHEPGGIVTYPDKDPYHYHQSDFLWCIQDSSWKMDSIGDWQHPRAQKMLVFTKT